jgi:hypothetical protein
MSAGDPTTGNVVGGEDISLSCGVPRCSLNQFFLLPSVGRCDCGSIRAAQFLKWQDKQSRGMSVVAGRM